MCTIVYVDGVGTIAYVDVYTIAYVDVYTIAYVDGLCTIAYVDGVCTMLGLVGYPERKKS